MQEGYNYFLFSEKLFTTLLHLVSLGNSNLY